MKYYAPWAKKAFEQYTSSYDSADGMIELKIVHTLEVVRIMNQLTSSRHLPEHTCYLAELCAMFHDIGRFEQAARYHTFLDHLSVNHARLGLEVLEQKQLLSLLSREDAQKVRTAIYNHNLFRIEDGLTGETLTLCKLIRDADKCDIFRVFACDDMTDTIGYTKEQVEQTVISDEVMACFFKHSTVPKTLRKTAADVCVSFLAFFFDMNYPESIDLARTEGYYKKPYEHLHFSLPGSQEQLKQIFAQIEAV